MKIRTEWNRVLTIRNTFPALLFMCLFLFILQNYLDSNVSLFNRMERDYSSKGFNVRYMSNFKEFEEKLSSQNNKNNNIEANITSHANNFTRKLPNAIIIGVKKCGTRALLEYLRLNPNIKAAGPEPHFFDRYYHLGLNWYRQKMPKTHDGQLTIEKTPRYFITKEVPERIYNMSKSIKLILVVRNPVTRAISDFTQAVSKGEYNSNVTFQSKAIRRNGTVNMKWSAVNIGLYVNHLKRWLEYFSMENIHIVDGEKLITNPVQELNAVQDFLEVPREISDNAIYMNASRGFPCILKQNNTPPFKCFRGSKGRHHSYANSNTLTTLHQFYKPYNIKFYQMVDKHFAW
ncbi:heparan sulfate glucosamine 3-O-sulfotransferase 2-like [Ruditapes philippinarum]|uniref:heparan sulfate glucosamine 3-O-sulfotransferase 2-like n=1 Tax=Ruditapes philippinarum TaxID=129788 RepID=UPI00295BC480|nr:heparan sulfate glucosamine 3-O-sulfotransferase 2-like [Ruditapes philippinarum]